MKKALPVIILVVLVAAGLAVGIPMAFSILSKPTPKKVAEKFLALIGKNSYSTASDLMSRKYRKQLGEKELEEMATTSGLSEFASVQWVREQAKDRSVSLDGIVTTNNGETVVIRVNTGRDKEESWAIDGVIVKEGGTRKGADTPDEG